MFARLKIISAVGVMIFATLAVFLLVVTRDARPAEQSRNPGVITFTDHKSKRAYVVGGTDEGLQIKVTGASHCQSRIIIDGVRVNVGRKVTL